MIHKMKITATLMVFLMLFGCTNQQSDIQSTLDNFPGLSEEKLKVDVIELKDGIITLKVTGLSGSATRYINKGYSPAQIAFGLDGSTRPLMKVDEVVSKTEGIKTVIWKAE